MSSTPRSQRFSRFVPFAIFSLATVCLFVAGTAALLYLLFSQYTGVKNIWLLLCGAPVILVVLILAAVITLYIRYGRPLEELFGAINAVEEGNLSVRVSEDKSDMFSNLFKRFNKMVIELERAEQQRRNLTADIAHELRTPLHIIQGNLEGILDGVYEPTSEHINNTLDETRLLTRLVTDLQTLSLAETGHLPLHPTQFLLAGLIQDITSSFTSQAATLSIDLKIDIAEPNQRLIADYDRLNQVLSNIISNALHYTPRGGMITITTEVIPGGTRITIQDTGVGIPAEDLPFIFDRFWRADRSRSERTHSGLGLAITKQLIQAHGGTIEAQSGIDIGTSFVIELPEHLRQDISQPSE